VEVGMETVKIHYIVDEDHKGELASTEAGSHFAASGFF
jgi:hypothetical protein